MVHCSCEELVAMEKSVPTSLNCIVQKLKFHPEGGTDDDREQR